MECCSEIRELYHLHMSQIFLHGMCLDVDGTGAIAWGLCLLQIKVKVIKTYNEEKLYSGKIFSFGTYCELSTRSRCREVYPY